MAAKSSGLSLNVTILLCCFTLFLFPISASGRGINGDFGCAGCTFILNVVGQYSEIHNTTIAKTIAEICSFFPKGVYQGACYGLVEVYGPLVIKLLNKDVSPDAACHSMDLCYTQKGTEMCHLLPIPKPVFKKEVWKSKRLAKHFLKKRNLYALPKICDIPVVRTVCDIINRVSGHSLPGVDLDQDGFSIIETLRGTLWRGRDCDDTRHAVHPGAKPLLWDTFEDSNCNGIYGRDERTGRPYEDLYCGNSKPIGLAALGDSVTAHFHIPYEWANSSLLNQNLFTYLPFVVENEFDWPMLSTATGYAKNVWPIIHGPVKSVYQKLRKRNRCNHRDFQNLGVNGADSNDMQHIQNSLSRNNKTDVPLLVFYALVGNDVCNWHSNDTVAYMTTPKQMRRNIIKTLKYLDTRLPKGSHVLVLGLADGRVLYDNLHNRVHPLGNLKKNIRYKDLYDYLNCLMISPCAGWMGSNATARDLTTKRAIELSDVLMDVTKTHKFLNFDVNFMPNPLNEVLKQWSVLEGKENIYKLIDAVDGFHPNQIAQAHITEFMWGFMEEHLPHYIGDVNPFNEDIKRRFGDQGGY